MRLKFNIICLVLVFISFYSCTNEKVQNSTEEATCKCDNYFARGNVVSATFGFCSIVPVDIDYYYKKGEWTFWNTSGQKVAQGKFDNNIVTVDSIGGCSYSFFDTKINSDKWKFWSDDGARIQLKNNAFNVFENCDVQYLIKHNNKAISNSNLENLSKSKNLNAIDLQTGHPINEIEIENILFKYCLSKKGETSKLFTFDTNFITEDGYKIGMYWKDISPSHQKSLYKLSGWGYYVEVGSNWLLCFCEGKSCTDTAPTDNSQIKWIQKRL